MARMVDENDERTTLKALVMGASGSGKTALSVTAPRPLVLISEPQGVVTIRKRAGELGVPVPMIVVMETLDDYAGAVRALRGDQSKPFVWHDRSGDVVIESDVWPETVVIDSVTDACELVRDAIVKQSPPKLGDDQLEVFSQRHWNALKERCSKMFRAFRDLPFHVLFLALVDERINETSDGTSTRTIGPMVPMRSLPDVLMAATNVAGLLVRRSVVDPADPKGDKVMEYSVQMNGPSFVKVKPFRPLADREVADFGAWLAKLDGHMAQHQLEAGTEEEEEANG